jgi:hypothetical protein
MGIFPHQKLFIDMNTSIEVIHSTKNTYAGFPDFTSELKWLREIIDSRKKDAEIPLSVLAQKHSPPVQTASSAYASFLHNELSDSIEARIMLALILATQIDPAFPDKLLLENNHARLVRSKESNEPIISGDTVLWLIAGDNANEKIKWHILFDAKHPFTTGGIITPGQTEPGTSIYSAPLILNRTMRDLFLYNEKRIPRYSFDFPARRIEGGMTSWDDFELNEGTREALHQAFAVMKQHENIHNWEISKLTKPGCCVLFHGGSGQGKTASARFFGSLLGRDVYELAIEGISSKWVGESIQRFEQFFIQAEQNNWIVVINEADSLFGKRSDSGAGDQQGSRYADQDVSYLIQRMESFAGLLILTTNMRTNLDLAFQRRFDAEVFFSQLGPESLKKLFDKVWPSNEMEYESSFNWQPLFQNFPIPPASLYNVIRMACAVSLENGLRTVAAPLLEKLVKNENLKFKGQRDFSR